MIRLVLLGALGGAIAAAQPIQWDGLCRANSLQKGCM
jgi:hypothetical protein